MKILLDDRNLARQPLFWAAIFIPVVLFLAFSYPLWQHSTLAFNKDAYQNFLDNYKLPLYLLGTCVPLVAIVVSMHRTIQTERQLAHAQEQLNNTNLQIDLTQRKNKTDSYYSHVKFITEALNSISRKPIPYLSKERVIYEESLNIVQPYALYRRIFAESNIENGHSIEICLGIAKNLDDIFTRINDALQEASNPEFGPGVKLGSLIEIDKCIYDICSLLYLEYNPSDHLFFAFSHTEVGIITLNSEDLLKSMLNYLFHTVQQIADITGVKVAHLADSPDNELNADLRFYLTFSENHYFMGLLPTNRRATGNYKMGQRRRIDGDKVAT